MGDVLRVSNTDVEPSARFDVWRERVQQLLHPMDVAPLPATPVIDFRADFTAVRAAGAAAAFGDMSPVRTSVRRSHADCADPGKVQMFINVSGGGLHHARGRTWRLRPGGLLIECPDEARTFTRTARSRLALLEIDMSLLSIPAEVLRRNAFCEIALPPAVGRLFVDSIVHVVGLSPAHASGAQSYLTGIADMALRAALDLDVDHEGTQSSRHLQAITYMRQHLCDPAIDAEQIAAGLRMSRRTLFAVFSTHGRGEPPMAVLRGMRIDRAKELLTNSTATVRAVARQSGFSSGEQFARAFRKEVGVTPSDYRRAAADSGVPESELPGTPESVSD